MKRRSPLTGATVLVLALFSGVGHSQTTYARFPGGPSQVASPDGRYLLRSVDNEQEPRHSIILKDNSTGGMRKIYDYGRSASVVWAPDSRHFAVNDYAGSNVADAYIVDVNEKVPRIDVTEEIVRHDSDLSQRVKLVGWDHDYFGVSRWLDERRVVVHHWGHGGSQPTAFCVCYIYTVSGSAEKCARQPRGSDPEERCAEITP